jgi:mono/diheme cytochrome c family protein
VRTAAFILLAIAIAVPAQAAQDGATVYKRCAACHLPNGAGVPGAYPPLGSQFVKLATKPAGREFLVHAIVKGMSGPIMVDGKPYKGIMPAQTLDDEAVASVLNHVATGIAKAGKGFKPFTAAEVAAARASGAQLKASDIGKAHAGLIAK